MGQVVPIEEVSAAVFVRVEAYLRKRFGQILSLVGISYAATQIASDVATSLRKKGTTTELEETTPFSMNGAIKRIEEILGEVTKHTGVLVSSIDLERVAGTYMVTLEAHLTRGSEKDEIHL
jgi:hypothetical protein